MEDIKYIVKDIFLSTENMSDSELFLENPFHFFYKRYNFPRFDNFDKVYNFVLASVVNVSIFYNHKIKFISITPFAKKLKERLKNKLQTRHLTQTAFNQDLSYNDHCCAIIALELIDISRKYNTKTTQDKLKILDTKLNDTNLDCVIPEELLKSIIQQYNNLDLLNSIGNKLF